MKVKLTIAAAGAFTLAACASTPEEVEVVEQPAPPPPAPAAPVVMEQTGPEPGSMEEFAVNAGSRVFFALDRSDLDGQARATLKRQATWLNTYDQYDMVIEGHCDERGTREYNLALGARRANAVRDFLVAEGVDPSRVKVISYGKERPIDPRSTEAAWAKNRNAFTNLMVGGVG